MESLRIAARNAATWPHGNMEVEKTKKEDLVAASAAPVACTQITPLDLFHLYGQKLEISFDYIRTCCSMYERGGVAKVNAILVYISAYILDVDDIDDKQEAVAATDTRRRCASQMIKLTVANQTAAEAAARAAEEADASRG